MDPHRPELQRDDVVPPGRPHAQPVARQRRDRKISEVLVRRLVALVSKSICERNSRAPPATGALGSGPRISALSHGELTFAGATARFPELCAIGFKYPDIAPVHSLTSFKFEYPYQQQLSLIHI